ncbi:DUF6093 family protein [Actinoplanes palleronii]|uniref:Uncharacterized protein n=1 Tax=Actinoplanes palleronii TaxID=113570 RepID=A0ABQ4BJ74_9ACTN|nr:DUF6093 family protein [Actinoplanes palleronii]GIE70734.1 hypothetical protein Apa02nite_068420 [Actinoplanes palleronii]
MSRESVLARGRAAAEAGMVDACTIRRRSGETNDANGYTTPTYLTLYTGPCRVQQQSSAQAQQQDQGEDYLLMGRLEVQVPMSVVGVQAGDEVVITASANDPDLPGRVLLVHDLAHKTHATARRLGVVERTH